MLEITSTIIFDLCFLLETADKTIKNTAKNVQIIKSLNTNCVRRKIIIPGNISSQVRPKNNTDLFILKNGLYLDLFSKN